MCLTGVLRLCCACVSVSVCASGTLHVFQLLSFSFNFRRGGIFSSCFVIFCFSSFLISVIFSFVFFFLVFFVFLFFFVEACFMFVFFVILALQNI